MKTIIISVLALIALTCSCSSLEPISISQDSSMSILSNITENQDNSSVMNSSINQSLNNQTATENISRSSSSKSDLWSWGTIPEGYELNKNGTLTKLTDEEWKPSI
jgi:hypothetical protein